MPIKKDDQTQTGPAAGAPVADPADELTGTLTEDQAAKIADAGISAALVAAKRKEAIKALAETTTPEEFSEAIHDAAAIATAAKKGIAEALAAATSTMEVVKKMTDNAVRVSQQAAQIYNHIQPVSAAVMEGMREVTTAVLDFAERWQARQDDFYNSGKWDKLQQAFPEVTQDTAMPILFVGLMDDVLEHADAIKKKMAEYEADTGTALDFNDLTELEGGAAYETLLEAFIAEAQEEAGQEPKAAEILHLPSSGPPTDFYAEKSAVFQAIMNMDGRGDIMNAGNTEVKVKVKSDEVIVLVSAENNIELPGVEPGQVFPKYKREYYAAVYDAVNTLYRDRINAGTTPAILPEDVFRTMTYKTDSEDVSPQQIEAVRECIEYWRHTESKIDATKELAARGKVTDENGNPVKARYRDFVLKAGVLEVEAGGKIKEAYIVKEPPLFSEYAKNTNGHHIKVKAAVLNIKKVNSAGEVTTVSIPATMTRISVVFYMLRRVAVMREDEERARDTYRKYKNGCRKRKEEPTKTLDDFRGTRVILFESVFAAAEVTSKNTKTNVKEFVIDILKYWRAMKYKGDKGYIEGFKTRKKRKTIDAVEIEIW